MRLRRVAKYSAQMSPANLTTGYRRHCLQTYLLEDHVLHSNGISDAGMITDLGNKKIHIYL